MKRKVEVTLLGKRFAVRSDKDEAYVHSLANFVARKLETLKRSTRTISSHDLALLVALNLAEELFEAEERAASARDEMRRHTERILANIDSALCDTGGPVGSVEGDAAIGEPSSALSALEPNGA